MWPVVPHLGMIQHEETPGSNEREAARGDCFTATLLLTQAAATVPSRTHDRIEAQPALPQIEIKKVFAWWGGTGTDELSHYLLRASARLPICGQGVLFHRVTQQRWAALCEHLSKKTKKQKNGGGE